MKLGIRGWLLVLALVAALPVLLFASVAAKYLASAEREAMFAELGRRSDAVAIAVDQRLKTAIDKLEVLAESPVLRSGDLRAFYEYANRLVSTDHIGVSLAIIDAEGRLVMNTLEPFGTPLPHIANPENRNEVFVNGKPYVSDLFVGAVVHKPIFAVSVPVFVDDKIKYVLSVALEPKTLNESLQDQRLPSGWIAAVVDRKGIIVARTHGPETYVGKKATSELLSARRDRNRGFYDAVVKEGKPMTAAFVNSPLSGWSTLLALSHEELRAPFINSIEFVMALGALAIAAAAAFSAYVSRHLSGQVASVAQNALALGAGRDLALAKSSVRELDSLGDALVAARSLIQEREQRLRTIVDTAADAIIVVDGDGMMQSLNPAAERIFGHPAHEVVGQSVRLLMPEQFVASCHGGSLPSTFPEGKFTWEAGETRGKRKDGSAFPIDLAVAEWQAAGRRFFTGIIRDITKRKQAEELLQRLMRELSHRTKNALAVAQVIAWQTSWMGLDAEDYAERFAQRIDALVCSHDLLVKREWRGICLDELIRCQLAPFLDSAEERLSTKGPSVHLTPDAAQTFGLALHELATNAMKHGALSCPGGRIEIVWKIKERTGAEPDFNMKWREIGGRTSTTPTSTGFGYDVIKDMMEKGFDGEVLLSFGTQSFSWELMARTERMLDPAPP